MMYPDAVIYHRINGISTECISCLSIFSYMSGDPTGQAGSIAVKFLEHRCIGVAQIASGQCPPSLTGNFPWYE